MRVLVGGVVGAALASAGWLALEHFAHISYGWLVCLVGLGAGLGVRSASKASNTGGSLRGALAVILALAGIFLGRQVYTQIVQSTIAADAKAKVAKAVEAAASKPAEDAEAGEETVEVGEAGPDFDTNLSEAVRVQGPSELAGYKNRSLKGTLSESDMLWMSLSGLLAYVLGKHDGAPGAVEVAESKPTDESGDSADSSEEA